MKRILYALAFGLFLLAFPRVSQAALCPVSFTFTTGLTLTQTNLNANPTAFSNCFSNIDHTNIGSAGLYASNLFPTNTSQATFGGTQTYTFPSNITTPSTVNAGSSSDNNSLDAYSTGCTTTNVFSNNSFTVLGIGATAFGFYCQGSGTTLWTLDLVGNQAILGTHHAANYVTPGAVTATGQVSGSSIQSTQSSTQGLFEAGSSNASQLDYAITNAGQWTFSSPLSVGGQVTSSGSFVGTAMKSVFSGTQGLFTAGAATSQLDYAITNSNQWTFTAPLTVDGQVTSTGSVVGVALKALTGPITQVNGATTYTVPYDANSTSGTTTTHVEHWSDAYGLVTNGTCTTNQWTFSKSFSASPGVTANAMFTPSGGDSTSVIVTAISSASAFIAVCNNSPGPKTITVTALAIGE